MDRQMEPTAAPEKPKADYADLDVTPEKKQDGKGKLGSLENPEVYEDVPGHVIPVIEREFDDFDTEAGKFLAGETPENEYIGFRLKQGVYGQRQPNVQMIRVKLPLGGVTPDQMDAFAGAIENYAPLNKGHITTRQNIQIHHMPLPDAAKFIREISDSGLSSREGCGNTVRNVTGDPRAGVHDGELFDVTPYADGVRALLRPPPDDPADAAQDQDLLQRDPDDDIAISGIHDIGFIAKERDGVKGVEIRVGGGTSIMPRIAPTLYEFVELDNGDYLKVTEACLRIFDRQDWLRVNRARARIKVLVDKIGMDAFRELVDEELEGDWVDERDFSIEHLMPEIDEQATVEALPAPSVLRQPERRQLRVRRVRRGERHPPAPGGLLDGHDQGDPRRPHPRAVPRARRRSCASTPAASPAPRCSRTSSCAGCATRRSTTSGSASASSASAMPARSTITDVVSCPGTDSCKLGITSSMGLNAAIQERVESMDITDPLTKQIHIKMSGCPNGCGQHHIGTIGFYGASIKVGEHTIPAYIPHIGGNFENGDVVFGERLKAAAAREAGARGGRALDPLLRGRAQRGRGLQRLRRARRRGEVRGARSRTSRCRSSSTSTT